MSIVFSLTTAGSIFTLARSTTSVNEGSSFTITLTTSGVPNGVLVPYTITGVSSADIGNASLTGVFVVSNNTASATFTVTSDQSTEGTETFTLTLDGKGQSISVIFNDTSLNSNTLGGIATVKDLGTEVTTPTYRAIATNGTGTWVIGMKQLSGTVARFKVSTDNGDTWTTVNASYPVPPTNPNNPVMYGISQPARIRYINGMFYAILTTSYGLILRSVDGINWTAYNMPATGQPYYLSDIATVNNRYVILTRYDNNAYYTSTDFITWSGGTVTAADSVNGIMGVGGDRLITTTQTSNVLRTFTTANGTTWTPSNLTYLTGPGSVIEYSYNNGVFVIPLSSNTPVSQIFTLDATATTATVVAAPAAPRRRAVAYGKGTFLAVDPTTLETFTSPDGTTPWVNGPALPAVAGYDMAYGAGRFIITPYTSDLSELVIIE